MIEEYVKEFERWVAGPKWRKARVRAELEEHLREAEAAGDVAGAIDRLGTPREAAKTFSEGHKLQPSSLPRRIGAALTDAAIFSVLLIAGASLGTWSSEVRWWGQVRVRGHYDPFWEMGALAVILIVAAFGYWVVGTTLLEWRTGRTLGKALFGLRVVTDDGIAPSFGQIVLRRLTLVFSGPLQLIDWAFMFFTDKHQRAFDILAKTVVVEDAATTERLQPATAAP